MKGLLTRNWARIKFNDAIIEAQAHFKLKVIKESKVLRDFKALKESKDSRVLKVFKELRVILVEQLSIILSLIQLLEILE